MRATCFLTLRRSRAGLLAEFNTPAFQRSAQTSPHTSEGELSKTIDFEDPCSVFATKSSSQLLKSCAILSSCRIQPLVQNARRLLDATSAILGPSLASRLVEKTYFDHFCAGYSEASMAPKLAELNQKGITTILNYAAEDDVTGSESKDPIASEPSRDVNAARFVDCVRVCNTDIRAGFVALKVSALGDPDLLAEMSTILRQARDDIDRGHSSSSLEALMSAKLGTQDLNAYRRLQARLHNIAEAVVAKGKTRMLVDAETTVLQPAIDALVIALQQQYNRREAVVMNTYQCYLKDSQARIATDMKRSVDEGWHWGAKTVRGAYLHAERMLAEDACRDFPIHNSLEETHNNYNECVKYLLQHVARGGPELMVATHNQQSVEKALQCMQTHSLKANDKGSGLYFAQLLGMADNLTYPLGAHGYNVYKMCAYGEVEQCMSFLIRRALENSDAMGGCQKEIKLARAVLFERMKPEFWRKVGRQNTDPPAYA